MRVSQKMALLIGLLVLFAISLLMLQGFIGGRSVNFTHKTLGELSEFRLVMRSVKYGMLFILLTFGVFFLFEVLHDLRIHLMQYLLVGIALVLFLFIIIIVCGKNTVYLGISNCGDGMLGIN